MAEQITLANFNLDTTRLEASLSTLQEKFFDLRKKQKEYTDESKNTQKEIDNLKKAQDLLSKSAGDNTAAMAKNEAEITSLTNKQKDLFKSEQTLGVQMGSTRKEITQTTSQLKTYQDAENKTTSLIDLGNQALQRQINNKNDARAANIALNNIVNQLNPSIDAEKKAIVDLNVQMDKNTAFIKDNSSETAKQKMNVGNYTESIKEAFENTGIFEKGLGALGLNQQTVVSGFQTMKGGIDGIKGAFGNFTNALSESKKAQIGFQQAQVIATQATEAAKVATVSATQIGFAYSAGLATETELELANSVATTANATATTAQATATVASTVATNASSVALRLFKIALISTGVGALVVGLGLLITFLTSTQEGIDKITAVTRPLQAIFQSFLGVTQDLGKSLFEAFSKPKVLLNDLVDFVKNNVINRFKSFGVILEAITNRDFKGLRNGIAQAVTGVENLEDKITTGAKATSKFLTDAAKKGSEIDELTKDIEKSQLAYNRQSQKTNDLIDEQKLKSKDISLSFKEREKASYEIIRLTKELGGTEENIVKKQIQRLKIEQSLNDTKRTGNQEMIDLEGKLNDAQDRGIDAQLEQMKVIAGARKESEAQRLKAIEDANNLLLAKSKQEIDLFVSQQGFKKKSSQEEFDFNKALEAKELADLKLQYDNGKISKTQYETEKNNITNDFAKKNVDLLIENAQLEVDAETEKNNKILESSKFLSDEQLKIKKEALANQLKKDDDFALLQFEKKLINQEQLDAKLAENKEIARLANEELEAERLAAKQEADLIDIENKKVIAQDDFIAQMELEKQQLDIKKAQEIASAEDNGAQIALINDKYAQLNKDIDQKVLDAKLSSTASAFGDIANLLGENSKAGKAAAIAQATINTYQGVSAAFMAPSVLPQPFDGISKALAAGVALSSGLKAVKEITKTKSPEIKRPSYATGGVVGLRGVGSGTSDSITANLSSGESVINARSTAMFAEQLSAINMAGGGVGLNGASNIGIQNDLQSRADSSQLSETIANAVRIGAEAGTLKGSKTGIENLSDNRKIMADAKF